MLIEFTVGNYKSIKDKVTLSMVAANISAKNSSVDENNVFVVNDKLSLLKTAAIYGANASGKSNLLSALRAMRTLVVLHEASVNSTIDVEPFKLSTVTEGQPTYFEIVFWIENVVYRYGFEITSLKVQKEWLFHATGGKRESQLFSRLGQTIKISPAFKEGRRLEDKTRENALFLAVVSEFNGKISNSVTRYFTNLFIVEGKSNESNRKTERFWYNCLSANEWENKNLIDFVKQLDTGIEDITTGNTIGDAVDFNADSLASLGHKKRLKLVNGKLKLEEYDEILSDHLKYDQDGKVSGKVRFFMESSESLGTQKLFWLSSRVILSLSLPTALIIDEFDAHLHPIITRKIVEMFNSKETNTKGAQLIIATHDTHLLDKELFRRDQVWFTEKDKFGATQLYSLAEFKPRNDAAFEKNYIHGKYGAIPFVGDLSRLVGGANGEAKK